jgi:hypothetical protein
MSRYLVAIFFLAVSPLCAAEVYKCDKPDGRTVFQNFPCPIDSIGSVATQPPPAPASAPAVVPRADAEAAAKSATPPEPRPGMTAADIKATAWGEPTSITEETYPQGKVRVWDYGDNRKLIFNLGGRVTSVQR